MRALAIAAFVAVVAFGAGYGIGTREVSRAALPSSAAGFISDAPPKGVDFSPVWKAWHVLDERFVPAAVASTTKQATSTESAQEERVWGMIAGMAASLGDPYTFFLPPAENEMFEDDLSGAFEGVGMEIAVRNQALVVVSPLKGTPAERAGLKAGDHILKIDDTDTRGMDVNQAVKLIRGPKGTTVVLFVLREGWTEAKDIPVVRDVINVPIVETERLEGGIFMIGVRSFTSNAPSLFRSALREFIESGDSKLIIDLRGNPGGYLEAAVDMASWFLPTGKVVVTEDYGGNAANVVHRSRGYNVFRSDLPVVILLDKGSASASEIFADALGYWTDATLVGTATFGKGSVQELVPITDTTALKVTVARWLGPDEEQIPIEGIEPDVEVKITDEDAEAGRDPQLEKAKEILNGAQN